MVVEEQTNFKRALEESYRLGVGPDGVALGTINDERTERLQYWRKPNGWITVGPAAGGTNIFKYQSFIQKRMRQLPANFGIETVGGRYLQPSNPRLAFVKLASTGDVVPSWLVPFFENGGHKYVCTEADWAFGKPGEYIMPKEQIIALGLHRMEWMRKDRPDVAGWEDVKCPYGCLSKDGSGTDPRVFGTEAAMRQHVVAAHPDTVAAQSVGDTISRAMRENSGSGDTAAVVAAVIAALKEEGMLAGNTTKPAPAEEPEAKQKYPDGTPDETWSRAQLMAYCRAQGYPWPGQHGLRQPTEWWLNFALNGQQLEQEEPEEEQLEPPVATVSFA